MSDPINPSHYSEGWSNGAEVIDISEHLTSNGGQALQYIARATHQNESLRKHDSVEGWVEDLRKAVWFLQREIERLEGAPKSHPRGSWVREQVPPSWCKNPREFDMVINGGPTLDAPRKWSRLEDIPDGVTVRDNEGDFWKRRGDDILGWLSYKTEADAWTADSSVRERYNEAFGPFTEVKGRA